MAQTESKIRLIFDGVERGVVAAAAKSSAAIRSLDDDNSKLSRSADKAGAALGVMTKGMFALGGANSAIQVIGGTVGALTQLAPAALLLPGALLAGAAAMGTFKIATAGVGDALKAGLSGDMKKFAEATKDMAPAMQDAMKSVVAFKPQIDDLKKTVQGNFWKQFSGDIKGLGDSYLPIMKTGLGDIATQMGTVVKGVTQAAQTPFLKGAVASILQSTAGFFREVGSGAGDVATGIVGIGKVGATYLPRLGEGIGGVAKKFGDWVKSTEGQNKIRAWIDRALDGFKDLFGIVRNVGSILGSVFSGLGGVVESPLARIEELTGKVADFLKSVKGQDALRALGEVLQTVGEQVGRILDAGLDEIGPTLVALAPPAKEIAKTLGDLLVNAIRTLGPLIRGVANVLGDYPGVVGAATVAVAGFWAAVKVIKLTNTITDVLGLARAFGGVGPAAEAGGKAASIAWGKGFIGGLGLVGAGVGATIVLDKVLPKDAATTHGSQVARDMLGQMAAVFQGNEGNIFRQWDVAKWISSPLSLATDVGSKTLLGWVSSLGSAVAPAWDSFVATTRTKVDEAVTYVTGLPERVGAALSSFGASLAQKATDAWQSFRNATLAKFDELDGDYTALPDRIGAALGNLTGMLIAKAIEAGQGFLASLRSQGDAAVGEAQSLPGRIGAAVSGLVGTLTGQASAAWNSFRATASSLLSSAVSEASSAPGRIGGAISGLAGTLAAQASAAWNSFLAACRSGVGSAVAFVRGLPGQIASAASGMGGALVGAGQALIHGLTAGMRSAMSAALAFARSIASQIAAVKGPLPKDRKTLVPAGEALMAGLQEGMATGLDDVLVRTSAVGGAVGATVTGGSPVGNPLATGGAGSPMASSAAAALRPVAAPAGPSSGGVQVSFTGNTSDALATVIMSMVRTGKIRLKAA